MATDPVMIEALVDELAVAERRQLATNRLVLLGVAAVEPLAKALDEKGQDQGHRQAVVTLLGRVCGNARKLETNTPEKAAARERVATLAVQRLVGVLANRQENVALRVQAGDALAEAGPWASPAWEQIAHVIEDRTDSPAVRAQAAFVLATLYTRAKETVALLIGLAEDEKEPWPLRRSAIMSLPEVGAEAREAVEALQRMAQKAGRDTTISAPILRALDRIGVADV